MKRKFCLFLILFLSFSFFAYSQSYSFYDLNKEKASWSIVLGGNVICPPKKTSYGYASLCEGKMMAGFSSSGKLLWQKSLKERPSPYFSITGSDLILLVTKNKKLNLFNPEGLLLWTKETGFNIKEAPLTGRDGRIFVRGSENISCYSLKGSLRWNLEIKNQNTNFPLYFLNDGSILVFFSELKNGKSSACRISPFGKIIENIVFAGQVSSCLSVEEGLVLTFTDFSCGLCSVKNGQSFSKWVFKDENEIPLIAENKNSSDLCLIYNSKALFLDLENGNKKNQILFTEEKKINKSLLKFAFNDENFLYICDKKNALCIDKESNTQWLSKLSEKNFPFIFYTDEGYLVFCSTSWSISAYRMNMSLSKNTKKSAKKTSLKNYSSFYPETYASNTITGPLFSENQIKEIENFFTNQKKIKENEIKDEAFYLSALESELMQITSDFSVKTSPYQTPSFFKENISYTQDIIKLASLSGLNLFQKNFLSLLKKTSDPSLILCLVTSCGNASLDENGEVLDSFSQILFKMKKEDSLILKAVCDSTFNICTFMGKPLLLKKGKQIIAGIMAGAYSDKTKEYARKTMQKILELNM